MKLPGKQGLVDCQRIWKSFGKTVFMSELSKYVFAINRFLLAIAATFSVLLGLRKVSTFGRLFGRVVRVCLCAPESLMHCFILTAFCTAANSAAIFICSGAKVVVVVIAVVVVDVVADVVVDVVVDVLLLVATDVSWHVNFT